MNCYFIVTALAGGLAPDLFFVSIVHNKTMPSDNDFPSGRQLVGRLGAWAVPFFIGRICYFVPLPVSDWEGNLSGGVVEIKNDAYLAGAIPPSNAHYLFRLKPLHGKARFIQVGKGGDGLSQRDKVFVKCQQFPMNALLPFFPLYL